ncbi:MAG: class II aldolase/adducin family protein [Rhodospirillaceae bacterium]|nr:class II aldolase/adducin family protein [Rhodospirillaceae bacterium]MBL6942143.1 class II aldolase/adducin family protein [Rhodospirillales bacterium]
MEDPLSEHRVDMAAAFRWTARLNMHEGIANHFSLAVSDDGSKFLLNPYGRHFSKMRASDLLLINANDPAMGERDDIDPTAWCIHGAMHRNNPGARCIMHVHSKFVTALASLKDSSMPPIDQNTMRFYNRIAVDDGFDGMGMGDEAERLSTVMGNKRLAIMGNHGVMVIGNSVAEVFDDMYYFERACETLITALSTGRELRIASPEVAEKTAQQFENYPGFAERHLAALKDILDSEEPDYRD